ncbi:MsnO8 family LLM class oxidoreductase [Jeotgalicoccus meleagridis]|uniref:Alkanal monooxygenase alpha chain n=1 Tax=Jeotgalicoccus meleagridis TaxID=2759181 RepID=A0A6V7RRS5_9STAP|nr:MsnO8 family LLM class oxidoreductase [Jeotgalicoccus meleagridis]CAD2080715.1 Alkanal monooxygenase alpha chain [Jeotgalicoccus meleagridis]
MQFSLLNQSPLLINHTVEESLQHTTKLAKMADELGYTRYFVSEHHNMEHVIGTSPEVLVTHLLNHTKNINIGAGGVMLSHHNPFHVAEQFQLISHLAPGRVDLGVGKAPGGTPLATEALQHELRDDIDSFNDRFLKLKSYIDGTHNNREHLKISLDTESSRPTMYLLGSSPTSAEFAAKNDVNFIFAHFIKNDPSLLKEVAKVYKETNPNGKVIVALSVLVAESEEEKLQLIKENELYVITFENGKSLRVVNKEQVNDFVKTSAEKFEVNKQEPHMIIGSAEEILRELEEISIEIGIDEFMFHLPTNDHTIREKTVEALAPIHTQNKEKAEI